MFGLRRYPKRVVIEDYPSSYPPKKSHRLRYFLCIVAVAVLSATTWHTVQAQPQSNQEPLLRLNDVEAGQLLTKTDKPGLYGSALLQSSDLHFSVTAMVANAKLTQSFRNDSDEWVEGVYVFPLPENAAVHRMRIKVGERIIEGEIKEKAEAKKIYLAAKKSGRKAGLVEQERPNMFTSSIANIAPHETIQVELEYVQTISYEQGVFGLRFPMTITPRYIPGANSKPLSIYSKEDNEEPLDTVMNSPLVLGSSLGWAFNTPQVPDANRITPPLNPQLPSATSPINPITITADIDVGMPLKHIDSAYHSIVLSRKSNRYHLRLDSGRVSMTQDFVLTWQPAVGHEPAAALFSETLMNESGTSDDYALLMLVPPQAKKIHKPLAKEVIYIIDTSGSMGGVSIEQARQGLLMGLDRLSPEDSFNIIEFNSKTYPLYPTAVSADHSHLQHAKHYVSQLKSRGGTEMLSALRFALKHQSSNEEATQKIRQVIFMTDGSVGNETALFEEIHKNLGDSRLFTVGIGSAPNSYFMRKAAQFGRGSFTYIGNINEVSEKMAALFEQLESPIMRDIKITWPKGQAVEFYPKKIPDLYHGEPLVVSAKTTRLTGSVKVSGVIAGKVWERDVVLNNLAKQSGVSTLWAREKISRLLDEKTTGRNERAVRDDVLAVALNHQLMSPYTSFVAVEKTPSRAMSNPLSTKAVANARPKGQSPQTVAYPQTATRAPQSFILAVMCFLLAALWRFGEPLLLLIRSHLRASLGAR